MINYSHSRANNDKELHISCDNRKKGVITN